MAYLYNLNLLHLDFKSGGLFFYFVLHFNCKFAPLKCST